MGILQFILCYYIQNKETHVVEETEKYFIQWLHQLIGITKSEKHSKEKLSDASETVWDQMLKDHIHGGIYFQYMFILANFMFVFNSLLRQEKLVQVIYLLPKSFKISWNTFLKIMTNIFHWVSFMKNTLIKSQITTKVISSN